MEVLASVLALRPLREARGLVERAAVLSWLAPSYPYRQTVIVNLKSGRSFRGVLWQRTGGFLVLKQAAMHMPRDGWKPVDGETLVPFDDVEFMQVVQQVVSDG